MSRAAKSCLAVAQRKFWTINDTFTSADYEQAGQNFQRERILTFYNDALKLLCLPLEFSGRMHTYIFLFNDKNSAPNENPGSASLKYQQDHFERQLIAVGKILHDVKIIDDSSPRSIFFNALTQFHLLSGMEIEEPRSTI
jgi:hypothetical protein